MLSEIDAKWLRDLDKSLWPPEHKNGVVSLEASRDLTHHELERLTAILEGGNVVVELICTNMFGGYGIDIYEHEPFPHTGPQFLARITEDHLPASKTRYQRGDAVGKKKKVKAPNANGLNHKKLDEDGHIPGTGSQRAWKFFSKYTHTTKMKELCKRYKLREPQDQSYYDY